MAYDDDDELVTSDDSEDSEDSEEPVVASAEQPKQPDYVSDPELLNQLNAPEQQASVAAKSDATTTPEYITDPELLKQLNAPESAAADGTKEYVTDPDLLKQLNAPDIEPESALGTFTREIGHGVGPAAAAAVGGGAAAGAAGAVAGPIGAIGAGLVGGALSGFAADYAQEKVLDYAKLNDAPQRESNIKEHPWAAAAGTGVSNLAGFGMGLGRGAISLGGRLLSGAISGAGTAGVETYHGTPLKEAIPPVVASTAAGLIAPVPYKYGRAAAEAGERAGTSIKNYFSPAPTAPVPRTAEPPAQGQLPVIGGGERQIPLPLEAPKTPEGRAGVGTQPELPLEPPPTVNKEGKLSFSITAPDIHSRPGMPDTGGVAKEAVPPSTSRPRGEPDPYPHSAVSRGFAAEAEGVKSESGINVLQPGQVDPTVSAGLKTATPEPRPAREAPPQPTPYSQALDIEAPRIPNAEAQARPLEQPQRTQVATGSTQGAMPEPPVPAGRTRLYKDDPRSPQAFTADRAAAEQFGPARHVDVSPDELARHFQPGREEGSYVAHPTLERVYNRRLQDTQPVLTTPTRGDRGPLSHPPVAEPPHPSAPPPVRRGPPPSDVPPLPYAESGRPMVSDAALDAKIAKATAPEVAAPKNRGDVLKAQAAAKRTADLEVKVKTAADKFSAELDKAEKAAEKAGKTRDDYHGFLSPQGKAALREHTRLAEQFEEAKFNENYKTLLEQLPEGYTATREKSIRQMGDDAWRELEGTRHDRNFDIRDPDGAVVGGVNGTYLFDKDIKSGWFADLVKTGHAEPVMTKALRAAREAGGVPEGVTDLNFERARGDLEETAKALDEGSRKPTGKVEPFVPKTGKIPPAATPMDKTGTVVPLKNKTIRDKIKGLSEDEKGGGRLPSGKAIAEAIKSRLPSRQTVGEAIKAFIADERGGGKLPGGGKNEVIARDKFGNEVRFTGATVHEAAAKAKAAKYNTILNTDGTPYVAPKAAAQTPAQTSAKPAQTTPQTTPQTSANLRKPPQTSATPTPAATKPAPPVTAAPTVAGSRARILSQVASKPPWYSKLPTSKAEAKAKWREGYTALKNAMDPIEQLKKLDTTKSLKPEEDFAMLARLTKGLGGRFNQIIKNGTYDIRTGKVNGKGLDEVIKPIQNDPDGFTAYALAKRTIELEGRGVKTGMPLTDARVVAAADAAKFEPVFRDLVAFQDRVMDNMAHAGILDPASVAKMRQLNKEYVPFYRMLDPKSELGQHLGSGLQTKDPIFKIKGSDKEVFDPIDSIVKNSYVFTDLAERNRALSEMKKFNDTLPLDKQFMQLDRNTRPIEVQPQEIQKFMNKHGIQGIADDTMTIFRRDAFRPEADKIRIYENGKPKIYTVPENLGTAVNSMDRQSLGLFFKIMGTPARMLRSGAVLSPEFMLRNPLRDLMTSFVQAKHGSIPVYDFAAGLKDIFTKSKDFQEWQINGGANANLVSMDRKILNMDPKTLASKVGDVVTKPYQLLQMFSELSENATRVGMYKRAVGKGVHPVEAAYESREGSLDFARSGASSLTRGANALVPFFNAQLEGVDRMARAFRDKPLDTAIKVGAGITTPSVLLWFANKDNERVQQLPQWQKDLFWIVPTDRWVPMTAEQRAGFPEDVSKLQNTIRKASDGSWQRNAGTIWKIPKPFEVGVLFGSVPERILDAYFTKNPNAFKGITDSVMQALTPGYVPQAVLPFMEQWANKSKFLDRPLLNVKQEKLPPAQQVGPQTSETAKVIGNVIRSVAGEKTGAGSPIMIDNYIRQWSGGLGQHVTGLIDKAIKQTQDRAPEPTSTMADLPGIKAFATRFPGSDAQSIKDFYDERKDRQTEQAGIKEQLKSDAKGGAERAQKAGGEAFTGEPFAKVLQADRDAVNRIMGDRNMSPDDKRSAIDLTYLIMIEHAKMALKTFEQTKRKETAK